MERTPISPEKEAQCRALARKCLEGAYKPFYLHNAELSKARVDIFDSATMTLRQEKLTPENAKLAIGHHIYVYSNEVNVLYAYEDLIDNPTEFKRTMSTFRVEWPHKIDDTDFSDGELTFTAGNVMFSTLPYGEYFKEEHDRWKAEKQAEFAPPGVSQDQKMELARSLVRQFVRPIYTPFDIKSGIHVQDKETGEYRHVLPGELKKGDKVLICTNNPYDTIKGELKDVYMAGDAMCIRADNSYRCNLDLSNEYELAFSERAMELSQLPLRDICSNAATFGLQQSMTAMALAEKCYKDGLIPMRILCIDEICGESLNPIDKKRNLSGEHISITGTFDHVLLDQGSLVERLTIDCNITDYGMTPYFNQISFTTEDGFLFTEMNIDYEYKCLVEERGPRFTLNGNLLSKQMNSAEQEQDVGDEFEIERE